MHKICERPYAANECHRHSQNSANIEEVNKISNESITQSNIHTCCSHLSKWYNRNSMYQYATNLLVD